MFHILQKLVALILILIASPLLLFVSIIIILDDGFPVVFKHKRVGKSEKLFSCLKFRSMKKNSEEILKNDKKLYQIYIKHNYKIPEELETRFINIGAFIRKTSLDELPQLFNIVNGSMNLVGPRPIVSDEKKFFNEEEIKLLYSVRPGITGLWQVSGRSSIPWPERKYIELDYIKQRSFFFDLKIIFKTFSAVLKKTGAY
jgi:exopolysaccharide production protein ExoY